LGHRAQSTKTRLCESISGGCGTVYDQFFELNENQKAIFEAFKPNSFFLPLLSLCAHRYCGDQQRAMITFRVIRTSYLLREWRRALSDF
jgi:hypothetical protein